MKPGQPFCPKNRFSGMWLPRWLVLMDVPWAAKAVYARSANLAGVDGWCSFKVQWMADELGLDDSTVKRSLATLAERELLHIERVTGKARIEHRGNRYRFIWHPSMADSATAQNEPSAGRVDAPSAGRGNALSSVKGEEEGLGETPPSPPEGGTDWSPVKVDRKTVTPAERELCDAILAEFNRRAGTRFTGAPDHRRAIVGRIREHPAIELRHHSRIIAVALADPWWSGAPGPQVVYGKAGVFEQAVERARAARGSSLSADEVARLRDERHARLMAEAAEAEQAAASPEGAAARAAIRERFRLDEMASVR